MLQAIIGIPCDIKMVGLLPFHAVGEKYIAAAAGGAGGVPVLLPALGDKTALREVLELVDGVLLPGSPSNVEPHHYGGAPSRAGTMHDPMRDATTLPLIQQVLEQGIPLLGICRGFQEINVAMGGELYQHVQEEEGRRDHREPDTPTWTRCTRCPIRCASPRTACCGNGPARSPPWSIPCISRASSGCRIA